MAYQLTKTGAQVEQDMQEGLNNQPKENVVWDDLRFPFIGTNIDTSSGRIDYDYFNAGIGFQNTARYPNEPISILCQLEHRWKSESEIHPHIHWLQQSSDIPNFLLAYKIKKNGDADVIETDYSNYTFATLDNHLFTYTSGVLRQISTFPAIDMTGIDTVSALVSFVIFRDTANTSGEFAGADPSSLVEIVNEFDVHIQIDQDGSRTEYVK